MSLAAVGAGMHSVSVHADEWMFSGSTVDISTVMLLVVGAVGIGMIRSRIAER